MLVIREWRGEREIERAESRQRESEELGDKERREV